MGNILAIAKVWAEATIPARLKACAGFNGQGAVSAVALSRPALLFMLGISADGEGIAKPMLSCVITRLFFAGTSIV